MVTLRSFVLTEGTCIVCYMTIPVTPVSKTVKGLMCAMCQAARPEREELARYWKEREEELVEELERIRLARALTPSR